MVIKRYNNIVMDAEEVECSEFPGRPLLHLDFKAEHHQYHHQSKRMCKTTQLKKYVENRQFL